MSYLFHGQRSSEDVILVCRPHPFVLLKPMLVSAAILLVPVIFYLILLTGPFLAAVLFVSVLAAVGHGFLAWYAWNNSITLLTNERVVVLLQKSVFNREFSECSLASIQQVSHEIKGVFHTLLGYGTITIQSAGSMTPFQIPNISDPYEVQQEIQRAATGEGLAEGE